MTSTLQRIGAILLISGVAAAVVNTVHPHKIPWVQDWSRHVEAVAAKHEIKIISLFVALEKAQAGHSIFVDARPTSEFSAGHVPGAVSLPFQAMDELFEAMGALIDSGRELVLYCKNRECDEALLLAIELQKMGAEHPVLYVDGFELWEKHGGAVAR